MALTREEKLALIDALAEKKRRALSRRDNYSPNGGQSLVHASDKRVRAVFAGNGGGKTALGVNEALAAVAGVNPWLKTKSRVPATVVVVLDNPIKVEQTWLPEIKKWYPLDEKKQCHKNGKPYYTEITFDNGSSILFFFHDQEAMIFESIEVDFVVFDEPPPRHIFIALMRGGRKKHSKAKFLIIGTPLAAPWLRTEIYVPWSRGEMPDTECFRYGTKENEANLADDYMEQFGRYLTEKEKRVRFEGEFFDLDGLALAHLFRREVHVVPPPKWPGHWPTILVVDPAMAKAHVAVLYGITPENRVVALKYVSAKCTAKLFAPMLKELYRGFRVVDMVCDSLGSSDFSGGEEMLSFIAALQKYGVPIRATTYDEKRDEAFISAIQEMLLIPEEPDNFGKKLPGILISSAVPGLIADIETVQWEKVRNEDTYKPKLDISKKDYLATLKYVLAAKPSFNRGRERVLRSKSKAGLNNAEKWRNKL